MIKLGQVLKKFKSKKGREVIIRVVKKSDVNGLLDMINSIIAEDDFIILDKKLTKEQEKEWLEKKISVILAKKGILICAEINGKVIGNCEVTKKEGRLAHTGGLGISIIKEYREEGVGWVLMKEILKWAKKLKIKIVILDVFKTNQRALNFYKKLGFKIYGKLPKGALRRKKYVSDIKMYKEL